MVLINSYVYLWNVTMSTIIYLPLYPAETKHSNKIRDAGMKLK